MSHRIELWRALDRLTTLVANKYELSVSMDGVHDDARRSATIRYYGIPLTWEPEGLIHAPIAILHNTLLIRNENTIESKQTFLTYIALALQQLTLEPPATSIKFSDSYNNQNDNWMDIDKNQLIQRITDAKTTLEHEIDEIIQSFIQMSIEEKLETRNPIQIAASNGKLEKRRDNHRHEIPFVFMHDEADLGGFSLETVSKRIHTTTGEKHWKRLSGIANELSGPRESNNKLFSLIGNHVRCREVIAKDINIAEGEPVPSLCSPTELLDMSQRPHNAVFGRIEHLIVKPRARFHDLEVERLSHCVDF